jgi:hypothetical protein
MCETKWAFTNFATLDSLSSPLRCSSLAVSNSLGGFQSMNVDTSFLWRYGEDQLRTAPMNGHKLHINRQPHPSVPPLRPWDLPAPWHVRTSPIYMMYSAPSRIVDRYLQDGLWTCLESRTTMQHEVQSPDRSRGRSFEGRMVSVVP